MMKIFGIVVCVLCMTLGASAVEYPEFRSAVSTTGISVNFETLYSKADEFHMIYDIVDHDEKGIVLVYKDTGSWAIFKDDGTVVIASSSAFSLDMREVILRDLYRAQDLVEAAGGSFSDSPRVYYVDDPYMYRVIAYDFDDEFDLNLFVPNCTIEEAKLSVSGSDYAETDYWEDEILSYGQHYSIDGDEVSGCDAVTCMNYNSFAPGGISCVPEECSKGDLYVRVNPVDVTQKIAPGIHRLHSWGIGNEHTMWIYAVTSPSDDKMKLYSDDIKTVNIDETRSLPMAALYELIAPIEQADNTTIEILAANSTL